MKFQFSYNSNVKKKRDKDILLVKYNMAKILKN